MCSYREGRAGRSEVNSGGVRGRRGQSRLSILHACVWSISITCPSVLAGQTTPTHRRASLSTRSMLHWLFCQHLS